MEYDSSGTDDDLPPPHRNRYQQGVRGAGAGVGGGRSVVKGSSPLPRLHNDMTAQIHLIEREAYSAVLRAFKAQSDAITWEQEGLITELRKELKVSDEEHRELLSMVNADDVIQRIREWRKAGGIKTGVLSSSQLNREPEPSPTVSASRKKQKTPQSVASLSFGAPSPGVHPSMQPSSSALRGGPPSRVKNKKYTSIGPSGKAPVPNKGTSCAFAANKHAAAATYDPLIGRKVWTRWPEDNNFYEAVITDYNPAEGRHALVYDMNTANEAWEWVNLNEISPDDIRWEDEDPGISHRGGRPGPGRGVKKSTGRSSAAAGTRRGRGSTKGHPKKDFQLSHNGVGRKTLGDIEILHTETLIRELEKVFGASHPEPAEIEKAKKVLKDHEQALVGVIARLEATSDGESDEGRHPGSQGQPIQQEQLRKRHEEMAGEDRGMDASDTNKTAREGTTASDNQHDEGETV